jgi:hypothetical protein
VIGLPSLQTIDRAQRARIWVASEATDMRCRFDRLAEWVKTAIGENPLSGWKPEHSIYNVGPQTASTTLWNFWMEN